MFDPNQNRFSSLGGNAANLTPPQGSLPQAQAPISPVGSPFLQGMDQGQQQPIAQPGAPETLQQSSLSQKISQMLGVDPTEIRRAMAAAGAYAARTGSMQQGAAAFDASNEKNLERQKLAQQENSTLKWMEVNGASPELLQLAKNGGMAQAWQLFNKEPPKTERPRHIKGEDGYHYWIDGPDAGKRVNPGVIAKDRKGMYVDDEGNIVQGDGLNNPNLRKELDKKYAESYKNILEGRSKGSNLDRDLALLEGLNSDAPSGEVMGRLTQMFPGVSDKGALFNSIIKANVGNFRVEGSGSQSDIEFQAILDSMPQLRGSAEGRAAIISALRKKSQIQVAMGDKVDEFYNQEITLKELNASLQQLRKISLIDDNPILSKFVNTSNTQDGNPDVESILEGVGL